MAFTLSRIDRKSRTYDLSATVLAEAAAIPPDLTGVDVALLPPRGAPTASTVWYSADYDDGSFTVLLAGPDADSTGALVVPASADIWMRIADAPEVDAEKLERLIVLGGGTPLLPATGVPVVSVNGKTGSAVTLTASDVGAQAAGDYATNTALTSGLAGKLGATAGAGGALSGNYPNPGLNESSVESLVNGSAAVKAVYGSRPVLPGGYEDTTTLTRRAAVAVGGTAGGAGTLSLAAATFRYPFRLPVQTSRWRLHVRNYDSRTDTAYTGAITFNGVWIGQHALSSGAHTGAFTAAPVQALASFVTPADGSEYVSSWVTAANAQISPYTEHLLSVGWASAGAQTDIRTHAGAWYKLADGTVGGQQSATGFASIQVGILDIWIEVEYANSAPIIAFFGDSLTSGQAATRPLYDSFPMRFSWASGCVPVHYSYSGTTLDEWTTTTAFKWTKYQTGNTKPDAAVVYIGGNNIGNAETAAAVQTKLTTYMQTIRDLFGITTIYVATMTPRNWTTGDAKEIARQSYNTYLRGLPNGAAGVIDFDVVVRDPAATNNILAAYNSGDNVHLNTAGYAAEVSRAMGLPLVRVG